MRKIARPLYEWSRDCGNACGTIYNKAGQAITPAADKPTLSGKNKGIFLTMKGMKRKIWSADECGDGRVHPLTKVLPLCPPCGEYGFLKPKAKQFFLAPTKKVPEDGREEEPDFRTIAPLGHIFCVSVALQYAYTASVCFLESTHKPSH